MTWISVTESLPEIEPTELESWEGEPFKKSKLCLILGESLDSGKADGQIFLGYHIESEAFHNWWDRDSDASIEATHWMYAPEVPK